MKIRRFLPVLLVLCLMLALPVSAKAADSSGKCGENLTWTLTGGKLTISGTGPMEDYVYLSGGSGEHPWSGMEEQITSIIIEPGVTHIGEYAFCDFVNLTSVSIPDTVQSLGRCAFLECSSLTGPITIPDGVTEISYRLFMQCNALTGVTIPDSVTLIDGGAFNGCASLKSIQIPAGVTDIGQSAFGSCKTLKSIVFPEGITVLRAGVLGGCSGLTEFTIPENVTVLQEAVFNNCTGLTKITIPKNVTFVGNEAFEKCTNLTSVTFTGPAPEIGEYTFRSVTASVSYPGDLDGWDARIHQNYGGTLTWKVYCSGLHNSADGTVTQAPTCVDPGTKSGVCDFCGESYTRPIPPDGNHVFDEGQQTLAPTCTEYGTLTYTCTRCGETEEEYIQPTGHSNGAPVHNPGTKTHTRTCPDCGAETVGDCTLGDPVVTREATLAQHGIKSYTCTKCSGVYEEAFVYRLSGRTRYNTAFAIADALKEQLGVVRFDTVIVACGTNFADALPGSYLAAVKKAPILISTPSEEETVLAYIRENLKDSGTVYLLGGTAALPASIEEGLDSYDVIRLSGRTRYDTNLAILAEAGVTNQEILVCTGNAFADSLSASAAGKPILLVGSSLSDAQKAFLQETSGKFVIIGGTGAVSAEVEAQLQSYGTTTRLSGKNRYATSVLVAQQFFSDPDTIVLAYGRNFPDGLCGGPLAYRLGAPLVLTENNDRSAAAAYAQELGITQGAVLGGASLISDAAALEILGS